MMVWNIQRTRQSPIRTGKHLIKWNKDSCSKPQTETKKLLHPHWNHYVVLEEWRIPGSLLRIDFVCLNLKVAIEVSPKSTHGRFNKFFHKNSRTNYLKSIKNDIKKIEYLEYNGFKVLELDDDDIKAFSPSYIIEKFGVSII